MLQWLEDNFSEVPPFAFYRDLFPLGELDSRDAFTKGKYTALAIQIDGSKAKRITLTDELDNLEELLSSDLFTVISCASYAGKTMKAEMVRELYALTIDLDSLTELGIQNLFSQIENTKIIPRPTYIAVTSEKKRNVHLYYLFDEKILGFREIKESVARYKTWLTCQTWNKYITTLYKHPQQESISQGMRAVGSVCKNPSEGRVRVFLTGDKVSVSYLNSFAPSENQIELSNPKAAKEKTSSPKNWTCKPDLYYWFIRKIRESAAVGRRYFSLLCLSAYASKCGISKKQLERDALSLVPYLDSLSISEDNRFTAEEALKACSSYDNPNFHNMRRSTIERMSGITIPANKRNYRKRSEHLARVRVLQNYDDPEGNWRNKKGAPIKRDMVQDFAKSHPNMSKSEIARRLKVSRSTVIKWLKE